MPTLKLKSDFGAVIKTASAACYFLTAAFSESGWALDENRLWLPVSHEKLFLDLKKAAEKTEALDRCKEVVRGTIDLRRSKAEHPIYRIQCRQSNLRTYNEMVDGLSFETLTTKVEKVEELSEADKEALRLEEERKQAEALQELKDGYRESCLNELASKTKLFKQKVLLDPVPEPVEFASEKAKFYIDFDSVDLNEISLKYRAICIAQQDESVEIHIRKRREDPK